jgi:hypothetical protein
MRSSILNFFKKKILNQLTIQLDREGAILGMKAM